MNTPSATKRKISKKKSARSSKKNTVSIKNGLKILHIEPTSTPYVGAEQFATQFKRVTRFEHVETYYSSTTTATK